MRPDSELQTRVMNELAWDTHVDETAIGVSVHHGVVTLNGTVESWAQKHVAEAAVLRVAGVLDVANDIAIKPNWSSAPGDADIAEAVRNALAWNVFIPQRQIQSTVTDNGHVTLTGTVSTLRQRDDAERAVCDLEGVRFVSNELVVDPPKVATGELRSAIKEALERHIARAADRIEIEIAGDTVALTGAVGSWPERIAVIGAAKGTPGVKRIDDHLWIEL